MRKKVFIIALVFFIIDLLTKLIVDFYLPLDNSKTLIPHFFYLTKVYNYGASWSLFFGHKYFLIFITIIILVLLFLYQKKFKNNILNVLSFGLLYGGIFGNLVNRLFYGYVIDFLDFKIFDYDFPVFNVADIGIVIGIFLMLIAILKKEDEN